MVEKKELEVLSSEKVNTEDIYAYPEAENDSKTLNCLHPFYLISQRLFVPCGNCELCLKRYKTDWVLRISLEAAECARQNKLSFFLTLTFDDDHCPPELDISIIQKFFKRLRKSFPERFSYFLSGEYGGQTARPHFHCVVMGVSNEEFFISCVDRCWSTFGFYSASLLNYARAGYVTNYSLKKLDYKDKRLPVGFYDMSLDDRFIFLSKFSPDLLESKIVFHPVFSLASKRPGIARSYVLRNIDRLRKDKVVHFNGFVYALPRYFRKIITEKYPEFKQEYTEFCLTKQAQKLSDSHLTESEFYDIIEASKHRKKEEILFKKRRSQNG